MPRDRAARRGLERPLLLALPTRLELDRAAWARGLERLEECRATRALGLRETRVVRCTLERDRLARLGDAAQHSAEKAASIAAATITTRGLIPSPALIALLPFDAMSLKRANLPSLIIHIS